MVSAVKSMKDPQVLLSQMAQQSNPQLMQAVNYVKEHGNDPKAAFEELAKEKGIDPNEIIKMISG
jgi:hypothetical protein